MKRLFTIHDGQIQKQFGGREILRDVADVEDTYAEEVPQDELTQCDEKADKIIDVDHFQKGLTRNLNPVQASDQAAQPGESHPNR